MLDAARAFVRRQQFRPGPLAMFVNPFYLARRQLWREIEAASGRMSGSLLDVGCGSKPYRSLFATTDYIGLDIDSAVNRSRGVADVFYDGGRFPFADGRFGGLLCNQVLEHVFNPQQFLGELRRVLAVGGKLLITVPFVWDEHEQPNDFARYTSFGLKALLEQHGFRILQQRKLLADVSVIFQMTNAYLYKVTHSRSDVLNLLVALVLMGPISLIGLVLGACLPKNGDLFLDQLVLAERL